MEIYLAIDYGTVRVGLARSYGTLAEPLKILANSDHLIEEILEVIRTEHITQIVVGMSENTMAALTREFVDQLSQQTSLPIHYADETLSSRAVHQKLFERNVKKAQHTGPIDHFAAAVFLQEYLDTEAEE